MKKYLVITIDVEPDCTANWTYSNPIRFTGVSEGIAHRLQPLFNKYNIIPAYLINNVVLEDTRSVEVFKSLQGKFELGTHLHPEFIEPAKTEHNYSGKKGVANCCFYPKEIESEKIKSITRLFENEFGYSPKSFRAGRFSAGNNTINKLAELNYKVDSSVTPTVRWSDKTREHPVDFRFCPDQPYWVDGNIFSESIAAKPLLEVPVSIVQASMSVVQQIRYILTKKHLPFRGSESKWLRPVFSGMDDFDFIIRKIDATHKTQPVVVYNMMFHNVEIMPGLSPYSKTEDDCTRYLETLEQFFQYTNKNNIESIELSGLHEIFR